MRERYEMPSSTRRLREIKNAILLATNKAQGCVTHSVAIHFFVDCIIGFHKKSNNGIYPRFKAMVYSKDNGKTWHEYKDQFEPKEGYHAAVEYEPTESLFPTRQW